MLPKEQTMIRIDPKLKEKLRVEAEKRHRSLSGLCSIILNNWIELQASTADDTSLDTNLTDSENSNGRVRP